MLRESQISLALAAPEIRALDIAVDEKREMANDYLDIAVDVLTLAHSWDFVMGVNDHTDGTVADQAEYTLIGADNDCRAIYNVRVADNTSDTDDEDLRLLDKKLPAEIDDYLQRYTMTKTAIWVPTGTSSGSPQVTLYKTPSESGRCLRYRYWKNGVTFEDFPDDFAGLFDTAIRARFTPAMRQVLESQLTDQINSHNRSGGGAKSVLVNPYVARRNLRRAGWFGYSSGSLF